MSTQQQFAPRPLLGSDMRDMDLSIPETSNNKQQILTKNELMLRQGCRGSATAAAASLTALSKKSGCNSCEIVQSNRSSSREREHLQADLR